MKSTSFTGYQVARQQWSTVQSICYWRNLLVCVSVLTGHVQQQCWHYTVGKFSMYINCFYSFDLLVHCCIATSPTSMFFAAVYHSFSVKAIRLPCPYIYWLLLTVRRLLQIDLSQCLWCEVTLLSTFLSPYNETAWSFLVWQTWDVFQWGIQHKNDLLSVHAKVSASTSL